MLKRYKQKFEIIKVIIVHIKIWSFLPFRFIVFTYYTLSCSCHPWFYRSMKIMMAVSEANWREAPGDQAGQPADTGIHRWYLLWILAMFPPDCLTDWLIVWLCCGVAAAGEGQASEGHDQGIQSHRRRPLRKIIGRLKDGFSAFRYWLPEMLCVCFDNVSIRNVKWYDAPPSLSLPNRYSHHLLTTLNHNSFIC